MSVTRMFPLIGKSGSFGPTNDTSASRKWIAITDNKFDDEIVVVNYGWANSILPGPYRDRHPTYPRMLCRSVDPEQDSQSPFKWVITAKYSSVPLSQQQQQQQQTISPIDWPAKISWKTNKYQKAITKDINGNAIVNSAGDPFDPPKEIPRSRWVVTITKNVLQVPAAVLLYADGVNSTQFIVQGIAVPTGAAKVQDISVSEQQAGYDANGNTVLYYVFTWSFEMELLNFRKNGSSAGWQLQPLDQGYRCKDPNDASKRINITTNDVPKQLISSPALLDGNGNQVANPSTSSGVFLAFDVFLKFDFNSFPLA